MQKKERKEYCLTKSKLSILIFVFMTATGCTKKNNNDEVRAWNERFNNCVTSKLQSTDMSSNEAESYCERTTN